jgi:hypothetical protein
MNAWAIFGTVAAGLLFSVVSWLKTNQATRQGGELEAGKVSAAAATTEAKIAEAVVQAPTDRLAVIDQLKAGTF